jgi:hypothetical protein
MADVDVKVIKHEHPEPPKYGLIKNAISKYFWSRVAPFKLPYDRESIFLILMDPASKKVTP